MISLDELPARLSVAKPTPRAMCTTGLDLGMNLTRIGIIMADSMTTIIITMNAFFFLADLWWFRAISSSWCAAIVAPFVSSTLYSMLLRSSLSNKYSQGSYSEHDIAKSEIVT